MKSFFVIHKKGGAYTPPFAKAKLEQVAQFFNRFGDGLLQV